MQYSISDKKPISQEKKEGKKLTKTPPQPKEAVIDGHVTELGVPRIMLVTQHAKRQSFQRV